MRLVPLFAVPLLLVLAAAGPPGVVPEVHDASRASVAGLDGTDATRIAVLGVRLYMPVLEAQQALEQAGLPASAWHERDVACAGQTPGEPPSCVAMAVLTGPVGVTVRFVEDLPAHPRRSVVAEIQASEEPRSAGAQAAYHRRLLALYGPPDLSDAVGLQWGQLSGPAAHQVVARTRPMLESSHDEMVRLSDTGFEEREAVLAAQQPVARMAAGTTAPGDARSAPDAGSGVAGPTAASGAAAGPGAGAS